MAESGRYLYAISRRLGAEDLAGLSGLQGAPLDVVEHEGLVAIVSDVDLDEFGEEGLRRNLEDLSWLEKVARTHDAVVHEAASRTPTAPLRLATVCLGDSQVRARLDEWREALEKTLDRIAGRVEWSVKTFVPATEQPAQAAPTAGGEGAGAAYLKRRKEQSTQRERATEESLRLAEKIHARLAAQAVASRRLQPQDRRLTGFADAMTLNGAYLVEDSGAEEFRAAVVELQAEHEGVRLDLQGPWPPYSFATLDDT